MRIILIAVAAMAILGKLLEVFKWNFNKFSVFFATLFSMFSLRRWIFANCIKCGKPNVHVSLLIWSTIHFERFSSVSFFVQNRQWWNRSRSTVRWIWRKDDIYWRSIISLAWRKVGIFVTKNLTQRDAESYRFDFF